jgi:hypothetical protein
MAFVEVTRPELTSLNASGLTDQRVNYGPGGTEPGTAGSASFVCPVCGTTVGGMGFRSWFGHGPQKAVRRTVRSHRTAPVLAQAALVTSTGEAWAFATRAELLMISAPEAVSGQDDESRGAPSVVVQREWSDVDRATYDTESNVIQVHWVDSDEATPLPLDGRRSVLPQVLRERVQWSVVLAEPVKLPGGRSARVAVRRRADGELFSQVIGGGDVDLADPGTAGAIDAAEARVRSAAGLPA